jgi:hypothetical protein
MVWFEGFFGKTEKFNLLTKELTFKFDYNIESPSKRIAFIKVNNSLYDLRTMYMLEGRFQYGNTPIVFKIRDKMSKLDEFLNTITSISFLFHMWYLGDEDRKNYLIKADRDFIIAMLIERMKYKDVYTEQMFQIIENMKKMEINTIVENYF